MWPEFISHFEELRRRLIICLAAFFFFSLLSYFFAKSILDFFIQPLSQLGYSGLYFQKPHEAFLIYVKTAMLSGFLLSLPVLLTQLWFFIAPGLYEKEKKMILPVIFFSVLLFLAGTVFAYTLIIPFSLHFLLSFGSDRLAALLSVNAYFDFFSGMILAFGFLFDFPIVILGLITLGIVSTETLAKIRKIVIVLIFIAAALLTPSPDPVSQILLAAPLWLLFEISLWLGRNLEKKQ